MKRRNADCGKIRRPIKRNKIAEQIGSNTLLYVKFLLLWAFVITADFLLEFRFEFLWPFWLLLRSVYDSFKYKGLAFSVLFVCIAITSDLVCLFFIPVQWLFFAASTYVWVQYVWHTDKGICLPTIILWILFVYLEAAIRWKDSRNIPHLDLCRPFAAHCIGYPVVTLGFGFKSYVGYRIRQRKQREVAKDNDFYMQLLQEALPKDETAAAGAATTSESMSPDHHNHHHGQDHQLTPATAKDMVVSVAVTTTTLTTTTSAVIQQSNTNGHGHNHHHHSGSSSNSNNNHHHNSSKNAQSHVNGHAGGSGSTAAVASTNSNGSNSSTMNGGVNHSKHLHRKSLDKDSSSGGASSPSGKANNSYSYHQQQQQTSNSAKEGSRSSAGDSSHSNGAATSPREKKDCDQFDSVPAAVAVSNSHDKKQNNHQQNGHVVNYEPAEHLQQQIENDPPAVEPKASSNRSGRKNRVKQKADQQQQQQLVRLAATLALASSITTLTTTTAATTTNTTTASAAAAMASKDNHQVSDAAAAAASPNNTQNGSSSNQQQKQDPPPPPIVQTVVQTVKVCETCARMEADARKLRTELGQLRQNENELRQKYDSNTANLKGCLQAKQKEHDELQTRFQELTAQRQQERQSLQTVERRLGEERRHRQSLESQLQNERKHRKQAEEKAARASADCGEQCKLKRQQMDHDLRELRRELMSSEESRNNAEKQNRNFEQEMRKFEVQLRNRESQQSSEVLMSALAAMQDKNATLEKNLSAETRVKLDLFSALGETRRQLEIATCSLRTRDKEILDLKAKIVQLLAVMPAMPNDSLCLTGPGPSSSGSGNVGGLRLSDAPQLLSVSALNGGGSGGGQPSPMSQHMVMNSPPLINQLGALGVLTSTITTSTAPAMVLPSMQQQQQQHHQQQQQQAGLMTAANGQIVQMQNSANCPSNLDPNASVYTPKNCSQQQQPQQVGGTEA